MDEPLTFHVGEDYHWRHRLKIPYMPEMTLPMKKSTNLQIWILRGSTFLETLCRFIEEK
jgi:hypothetical protein